MTENPDSLFVKFLFVKMLVKNRVGIPAIKMLHLVILCHFPG